MVIGFAEYNERVIELENMCDGWLDGEGISPSTQSTNAARKLREVILDHDIELPCLFPIINGGLEAEFEISEFICVTIKIDQSGSLEVSWGLDYVGIEQYEKALLDMSAMSRFVRDAIGLDDAIDKLENGE